MLSLQEKNEIDQDQEVTVEEKIDSMEKGNILIYTAIHHILHHTLHHQEAQVLALLLILLNHHLP